MVQSIQIANYNRDFRTHSQQQCFQVPSALIFYALFNVTAGNLFVVIKHWNRDTEAIRMALEGSSERIKRLWTHKRAPFLRCSALLLPSMLMNLSSSVPNFSSPAANSSYNTINEQTLLRFATQTWGSSYVFQCLHQHTFATLMLNQIQLGAFNNNGFKSLAISVVKHKRRY